MARSILDVLEEHNRAICEILEMINRLNEMVGNLTQLINRTNTIILKEEEEEVSDGPETTQEEEVHG
jgi:hypothetical protein